MLRPYTGPHPSQFDHVRTDFHAELFQEHLAHRPAGDPRHGLARARPLQDVARVLAVVLERAGEIGVSRARAPGPAAAPRAPPPGPRRPPRPPRPPNPGSPPHPRGGAHGPAPPP